MTLKKSDVYNPDGSVKNTAFIHDKKTGKANTLYLKPVQQDLLQYHDWLSELQSSYALHINEATSYDSILVKQTNVIS